MAYTPTTWTTGDTITATAMNKIEQGIAEGGGYDLVLSVPRLSLSAGNVEVIEGDILECEQKIANDEPVNAVLVVTSGFSYTPSGANAPNINFIARLTYWHCPYCIISFSAIYGVSANGYTTYLDVYNIEYDPNDGSITAINRPYATLID